MSPSSRLQSMTGFGRANHELQGLSLSVEFRSVNHRYLDMRVKLPSELNHLELKVREFVKNSLARGRVECSIKLSSTSDAGPLPQLQPDVVKHYFALFQELGDLLDEKGALPPLDAFLQLPGVLTQEQTTEQQETVDVAVLETTQKALEQLMKMRSSEGGQLLLHLEGLLDSYTASLSVIEELAPSIPKEQFHRLKERLKQFQLNSEVDETRLHQEVAIFAERSDITEELKRIKSHLKQFRGFLQEDKAVGRRMDFLCQELLRETNTIGSKNVDAAISTQLIDMKSDIEKLREQVQNVE